jgi:hypothetical protein
MLLFGIDLTDLQRNVLAALDRVGKPMSDDDRKRDDESASQDARDATTPNNPLNRLK